MRVMIIVVLILGLGAAGCTVPLRDPQSEPAPTREAPTREAPTQDDAGTLNSPAVVELTRNAAEALDEQRLDQAARLLERAIGIEPRNPALWHHLARVRYEQGNLAQAGQLAARSNSLLNAGAALKAGNDRLIEAAREAGAF